MVASAFSRATLAVEITGNTCRPPQRSLNIIIIVWDLDHGTGHAESMFSDWLVERLRMVDPPHMNTWGCLAPSEI